MHLPLETTYDLYTNDSNVTIQQLVPAFEGDHLYPLCCKLETKYTLVAFGHTQCLYLF